MTARAAGRPADGPDRSRQERARARAGRARSPVEIVSVDSAQVYRGMDIGTAKPDAATRARVAAPPDRHRRSDATPIPRRAFAPMRCAAIAAIRARGRMPLLVGGTMLYFKALTRRPVGAAAAPTPRCARRLDARAARRRLAGAARRARARRSRDRRAPRAHRCAAHPARARGVRRSTGTPLSALQGAARRAGAALGPTIAHRAACRPIARALHARDRRALRRDARRGARRRAARRCARATRSTPELPSMRCVGYRQAWEFLDGAIDAHAMRARALAATRQLAKRQLTWLRATDALAIDPRRRRDRTGAIVARIAIVLPAVDADARSAAAYGNRASTGAERLRLAIGDLGDRVEHDAVLAGALGRVHRGVGRGEQTRRIGGVVGKERDADAGADRRRRRSAGRPARRSAGARVARARGRRSRLTRPARTRRRRGAPARRSRASTAAKRRAISTSSRVAGLVSRASR